MEVGFYTVLTILIVITAAFSYINFRFIRLPATIGIMIISLLFSIVVAGTRFSHSGLAQRAIAMVSSLDFHFLLMDVLLSFLLFAGAIHIDINKLRKERATVMTLATAGVILSTVIIGLLMYAVFRLFGMQIDLIYCLLFGALISPTDPIAVMGILKEARIPSTLETRITGESLFNDGVGVVVFLSMVEVASIGVQNLSVTQILLLLLREAGGGLLWGWILGYFGFLLLRSIDNYRVEVLITLAMVMGGYAFASLIHVSGPLAMVVAGIIVGNKGRELAMSDVTRDYLGKFWELIDEILNAILFLLIGFESLVIDFNSSLIWIGLLAIGVVLLARWLSIIIPGIFLTLNKNFVRTSTTLLVWGGLRGGISVALALSIPPNMHRDELVAITYFIVVFSIIVQGLTVGRVAKRVLVSNRPSGSK